MTIKINGDNSVANPGFTGADTDTGLQVGTNELKLVTGGTARATVDSAGNIVFSGNVNIGELNNSSTTTDGVFATTYGELQLQRTAANSGSEVLRVYDGNTQKTTFYSNGVATFADKVESGPYSTSSGARLRSSGAVQIRRDGAGENVFEVYKGGTASGNITLSMNSDGGAYFDGNVGIGTDSPQRDLHIHNSSTSTNAYLHLTSATTGTTTGDGLSIWQYGSGGLTDAVISLRENASLQFRTNDTERLRILAGGGLTFNGDTATANALDDYEEGTFTPTIWGVTSPGYTVQNGTYTKIGDLVTFTIALTISSGTNNSNHVQINGLPFTSSSTKAQGGASISFTGLNDSSIQPNIYVGGGSTDIWFYSATGGSWYGTTGNGIVGNTFHLVGHYYV